MYYPTATCIIPEKFLKHTQGFLLRSGIPLVIQQISSEDPVWLEYVLNTKYKLTQANMISGL